MLNALSIDVEDWYHPELIRSHVTPGEFESQVRAATAPILALLRRCGVRATFFIVGELIPRVPDLVAEIAAAGHEIGCHGMSHRPLNALVPDDLRAELASYAKAISFLPDVSVKGFRAPTFSLDNETRWAVPILHEFGYEYDSSIFPVRNYLYGVADCPPTPYRLGAQDVTRHDPEGKLWEFPMSTWRCGGWKMPVSGGFYLRATPWPVLRTLLQRVNASGAPFVIYLHPWETHAETPRVSGISPLSRWLTYYNIGSALAKLERLLQSFTLSTLSDALAAWQATQAAHA